MALSKEAATKSENTRSSKYQVGDIVIVKDKGLGLIEEVDILANAFKRNRSAIMAYKVYLEIPYKINRPDGTVRVVSTIAVAEEDLLPPTDLSVAIYWRTL